MWRGVYRWRILTAGLFMTMATAIFVVDRGEPSHSPRHAPLRRRIVPISDSASYKRVEDLINEGGPEAYQAFFEMLKRPDPPSQYLGIWGLRRMDSLKPEAVPYLIPMLKEDWLAYAAADALGAIGPEARAAVPGLIAALDNQFASNRLWVALALGKIGPDAKSALKRLRKTMNDDLSPWARCAAALSIRKIDPETEKEMLGFFASKEYQRFEKALTMFEAAEKARRLGLR